MKQCHKSRWSLQAKGPSAIKARICISSTSGGGGKTLLSLGLAAAWAKQGLKVKPFKKGPDYIDAAWLSQAAGLQTTNLDPFFLNSKELLDLFAASMEEGQAEIGLIEGNRGLFDGLDESGACSTAQLCRSLTCPILLCIDCTKTTRTVAALLNGLVNFEKGLQFSGVILNRVGSERHETSLRKAIETCSPLKVLGVLPRLDKNPLPERHMGLASQGNGQATNKVGIFRKLANFISQNCNLEAILDQAKEAPPLITNLKSLPNPKKPPKNRPAIGVVRDKALWFYYPENLAALEAEGAQIRFLSLFDTDDINEKAWREVDGIYLGGGFPEDYASEISRSPYLSLLASYCQQGMPIYAECGGLIVLCKEFQREGKSWAMADIFPATAVWHKKPQGLGYIEANIIKDNPFYPDGFKFRAHEFHYSNCVFTEKPEPFAKLSRGSGLWRDTLNQNWDGLIKNNTWASYMHIFAPAVPIWAKNFVKLATNRDHL